VLPHLRDWYSVLYFCVNSAESEVWCSCCVGCKPRPVERGCIPRGFAPQQGSEAKEPKLLFRQSIPHDGEVCIAPAWPRHRLGCSLSFLLDVGVGTIYIYSLLLLIPFLFLYLYYVTLLYYIIINITSLILVCFSQPRIDLGEGVRPIHTVQKATKRGNHAARCNHVARFFVKNIAKRRVSPLQ